MAIRKPNSVKSAERLCELYAENASQIEVIDAVRASSIADANAVADRALVPLVKERDAIAAKLEPWWDEAKDELTAGKRKSVELGGCKIGTRTGKESLGIAGKVDDIVKKLKARRWAHALLRTVTSLDKAAALKALEGKRGDDLTALGLSAVPGDESFVLERVKQNGTIADAG